MFESRRALPAISLPSSLLWFVFIKLFKGFIPCHNLVDRVVLSINPSSLFCRLRQRSHKVKQIVYIAGMAEVL